MDKIEELLTRGVANIIPGKEALQTQLKTGKKLNIFLGIDPTAPKIHLGHAVSIRKLQSFVELGHNVKFLIGNFTSLIGDTSDKESERPILTEEEIEQNFQTYKQQAEKLLDFSKVTIVRNKEWLSPLTFVEIIRLTQHFSINDFISRDLIKKRLQEGKRVRLDEVLYPIMQGYDSFYMDTDLQLGGTDQTFNMQAGRTLQKQLRNKESFILSTEFLMGTDGRKMSKSWGNAIWLDDSPEDMYAKVMAVNDVLIEDYFMLGTNIPLTKVQEYKDLLTSGHHPMSIKHDLASQIVTELYNDEVARRARELFEKRVQKKEIAGDIEEVTLSLEQAFLTEDLLVNLQLASSKSEAKRLFEQGGVEIDGKRISDLTEKKPVQSDTIIRVGKRRVVKIIVK